MFVSIGITHNESVVTISMCLSDALYQVVDVCVATAEATNDVDALEVGMICVRNLQVNIHTTYTKVHTVFT